MTPILRAWQQAIHASIWSYELRVPLQGQLQSH